jgi:Flp pilus assembly secretin CpaC
MRLIGLSFTFWLACITTFAVAPNALAQTRLDTLGTGSEPHVDSYRAEASQVAPTPQPCPHPCASPVGHSEPDEAEDGKSDRVVHLRRAARHLKAAGELQLARRVTKEALLEAKLRRIRRLEAEVDELRAQTTTDQTVTLYVKVMELQVTKMRELGFDCQIAEGIGFEQINGDTQVELGKLDGLIQALREHGLVKVLAEPTLVTVSGRPATFRSGGEFPIVVPQSLGNQSVEYRPFGTRMDCVAEVLDSGRIRLDLRSTVSEIDTSRSVMIQQMSVPGLRTLCVDTAVEMEAGQTLVLSGMRQTRATGAGDSDGIEETALLVSVTANLGPFLQTEKGVASKRP